jgi:hypothetical protein
MGFRRWSSSLTIALSAALLFVIQPMIAKTLLPRFGGSAGVWIASMMFFQIVLLLGYAYSYWVTRYAGPRARTAIHLALLALSLAMLPLRPRGEWAGLHPTVAILLTLAATVGLPFFLLSTTNTLVQSWYARAKGVQLPYHLFALSNTACLLALLAYPLAIEPALTTSAQLRAWSTGYLVLVLLMAASAIYHRDWRYEDEPVESESEEDEDAEPDRPWLWIALAACSSTLWLAVANHLSQEVAAIPLLWVVPLTLYLLSFALCFAREGWYRPGLFRWLLPAAWIAIGWRIGIADTTGNLTLDIAFILCGLFVLCLFCHGELARTKPVARQSLAFFYLMTAAGGALGGIFVGVVAPNIFTTYLELPVGILGTVFLAMVQIYGIRSRARLLRLGTVAAAALAIAASYRWGASGVFRTRNFYGTLETRDRGEGENATRTLFNGRTVHGIQFLAPGKRRQAIAYYGRDSGVAILIRSLDLPVRRVATIGLGTGTLAAFGRKGDLYRFYEINPAVIDVAAKSFTFLADSPAATDVVYGDGRLRLAQEAPASFDAIVLDAFSDDAIPVHLLTREAFQLYFARLQPGGALAIHVSNRYLDLDPVVESLAASLHKSMLRISNPEDAEEHILAADWVIVAEEGPTIEKLRRYADSITFKRGPLWTDEYSNLLQIWR